MKRSIKPLLGTPGKMGTVINSCNPDSSLMDNVPLKDLFPKVKVRKKYMQERRVENLDSPSKNRESHDSTNRSRDESKIGNLESPVKSQENQESTRNRLRESLAAALRNFGDAEFNRSLECERNIREELEEEATRDRVCRLPLETGQRNDRESERKVSNAVDSECTMTDNDLVSMQQKCQQHGNTLAFNGNLFDEASYLERSPCKKSKLEENVQTWELIHQAENVAVKIEEDLFRYFGGVNKKYKEKARSLLFNLKDRSNPELRAQVLSGKITPESLCSMTAEQLASKELSQWRIAKAEELAHMVVLPDVEIDACRLVKKTHKGEVEVQMEKDDSLLEVVAGGVRQLPMVEVSMENAKGLQEKWQLYEGDSDSVHGAPTNSQLFSVDVTPTGGQHYRRFDDFEEAEFVETENLTQRAIPLNHYAVQQIEYVDIPHQEMEQSAMNFNETGTFLSDRSSHYFSNAQCFKDPGKRTKEANTLHVEKFQHIQNFQPLWEGGLQLSGSEISPVLACFLSGERVDLISWPEIVEVKGRVRLDALDKFLQDLHLSRTRSVMILSFRLENEERNATSVFVSKEVACQYEKGERVGFAEPATGFELYLFPSRGSALKLLNDHGYFDKDSYEENVADDEALVGCVVWRKNQVHSVVQKASSPEQIFKPLQNPSGRAQLEPPTATPIPAPMPMPKLQQSLPSTSAPHSSFLSAQVVHQDENDDDIPPGFGPAAAPIHKPSIPDFAASTRSVMRNNYGNDDDDDLPEFDFLSENATRELALRVTASKAPAPFLEQQRLPRQVPPFYECNTQENSCGFQSFNSSSFPHISPLRHPTIVEPFPRNIQLPILRHPAASMESIYQKPQLLSQWPGPPSQQNDPFFDGRPQGGAFLAPPLASSQLSNMAPEFNFGMRSQLQIHPPRPFSLSSGESKIAAPTSNSLMQRSVNENKIQGKHSWDDDDMPEWCPPPFIHG